MQSETALRRRKRGIFERIQQAFWLNKEKRNMATKLNEDKREMLFPDTDPVNGKKLFVNKYKTEQEKRN